MSGDCISSSEYCKDNFRNKDGLNICCHYWKPRNIPRALLLIFHGYSEHSMVYEDLAKRMAEKDFLVFAHDVVGHGQSEGQRGFIANVHDLTCDTAEHIKIVQQRYPNLPLFMFGFSMGAEVAVLTILEKQVDVKGIVLSAPAFEAIPGAINCVTMSILRFLNTFVPNFPLVPTCLAQGCRNEDRIKEMSKDPLICYGWWTVRTTFTLFTGIQEIHKRASEFKVPFLMLHGDNDKICNISGSHKFYKKSSSIDKTFKIYRGAYHVLLSEPEEISKDVMARATQWLTDRMNFDSCVKIQYTCKS